MNRLAAVLAALLVAALAAPGSVAATEEAEDPRFPTDWHVMATGAAGTFGGGQPQLAQLGHELGADLLAARLRMPDAEHVEFEIKVTNLPAVGGTPEFIRYTWDMSVDTGKGPQRTQLDGKFLNYTRGVCDPTAGCHPTEGDPPQNPGMRPFFWRGDLEPTPVGPITFNAMRNYATIAADFDVAASTITVLVPTDVISLVSNVEWGDCSQILPSTGIFGGVVEASPAAWVSSGNFPADTLQEVWQTSPVFVAPHALDAEVDCFGNPIEAE